MAKSLLKNYFMAIVAVVMIVGFSAFKVVENNNHNQINTNEDVIFFPYDDSGNATPLEEGSPEAEPIPSVSNPYNCLGGTKICSRGYRESDVELNENGMLVPKSSAVHVIQYNKN